MVAKPVSAEEVAEVVRAHARISAVGGRTKPALVGEGEELELSGLTGITDYKASEYTFTARAGTPVREVEEALEAKRQYLPFDPLFAESGATLGGTVASGACGPGRFRFGGLRDFLIGVQFVDGAGELVRSGGRVVKNAAGFDLPKLLVGSMGRFGVMTELSFKVFPAPSETVTLSVACPDHGSAVERLAGVASSRWEADALDYDLSGKAIRLRLGGPGEALDQICEEIEGRWPGEVERFKGAAGWRDQREVRWARGEFLVKVPIALSGVSQLARWVDGCGGLVQCWCSSGGNVAWLSFGRNELDAVDEMLRGYSMAGLALRGSGSSGPWLGERRANAILGEVKEALDPGSRFPEI
tara:strand:+ start:60993 stop:62060 length:1068 start_codon:yes stop_codon:yes gene_type:complete